MNLQKLFEAQAVLDADIEKHHPRKEGEDRLSKNILALLVELGECANEWRGFKYWSNDQEPRIEKRTTCTMCNGEGQLQMAGEHTNWELKMCKCSLCQGKGYWIIQRNLLLEEYVDCFSLILNIGNDTGMSDCDIIQEVEDMLPGAPQDNFISLFRSVSEFYKYQTIYVYEEILDTFYLLGKSLGFTWEQIEQAYFDKNKINHHRQETGY